MVSRITDNDVEVEFGEEDFDYEAFERELAADGPHTVVGNARKNFGLTRDAIVTAALQGASVGIFAAGIAATLFIR